MRTEMLRHGLVAGANGAVTLVILLIAPLGLAAVIVNTVLVVLTSFFVGRAVDRVLGGPERRSLGRGTEIERWRG